MLLAAALAATWSVVVLADGGAVQLDERAGPFEITVFTAPDPVAAGPVDVSVMVRGAADGRPVVDASVSVSLHGEDGTVVEAYATREQAQNKLLYAAMVDLPSAGRWDVQVRVERGAESAAVGLTLPVAPAPPPVVSFWPYFALPPLAVAVFGVHQRSKRRRSKPVPPR